MKIIAIKKWDATEKRMKDIVTLDNTSGEYVVGVGKLDVSGTPLFEGDIIDCTIRTELGNLKKRGMILWSDIQNGFTIYTPNLDTSVWGITGASYDIKKVGDMFTTPELLENKI